ncbi:MAG: glycosyltransferase, partial [Gemmatimonadetes bacterium]|nr:glycosyltransferase [Gemmatimonadota bacterium]
ADLFTDGREGFLVPARDALAIRERMEWLLDHPHERENMGNAARARVVALGGWRGYGERVERVYLELLARD